MEGRRVSLTAGPKGKGGTQIALALLLCAAAFLVGRYKLQHTKGEAPHVSMMNESPLKVLTAQEIPAFALDVASSYRQTSDGSTTFMIKLHSGAQDPTSGRTVAAMNMGSGGPAELNQRVAATVECLDNGGRPMGAPGFLDLSAAPNSPGSIIAVAPPNYPAETRSLRLTVYEKEFPAQRSTWTVSCPDFMDPRPPIETGAVEEIGAAGAVFSAQAVQLPESAGATSESNSGMVARRMTDSDVRNVFWNRGNSLPSVVAMVRLDPSKAGTSAGSWLLNIKRLSVNSVASNVMVQPVVPIYPASPAGAAGSPTAWAIYGGSAYPGLARTIRIDGEAERLASHIDTVTLHDADLVYNPTAGVYVFHWSGDQSVRSALGREVAVLDPNGPMPGSRATNSPQPNYWGTESERPGATTMHGTDPTVSKDAAVCYLAIKPLDKDQVTGRWIGPREISLPDLPGSPSLGVLPSVTDLPSWEDFRMPQSADQSPTGKVAGMQAFIQGGYHVTKCEVFLSLAARRHQSPIHLKSIGLTFGNVIVAQRQPITFSIPVRKAFDPNWLPVALVPGPVKHAITKSR